jgi:hypothetical protein
MDNSNTQTPPQINPMVLLQIINDYLAGVEPSQLLLYGAFLATIFFIFFPRLTYCIASVGFLHVAFNYAHTYHRDVRFKPLEAQIPHVATLVMAVFIQLYCTGKTLTIV